MRDATDLPLELRSSLDAALVALARARDSHPGYGHRVRLIHQIWGYGGGPDEQRWGPKRLILLGLLTLRRILPIWDKAGVPVKTRDEADRTVEDTPHFLLGQIERSLSGEILDPIDLRKYGGHRSIALQEYAHGFDRKLYDIEKCACDVLLVAAKAMVGSHDYLHPKHPTVMAASDRGSVSEEMNDFAGLASGAYQDSGPRRAFWVWWLDEAIPTAYTAFPPLGDDHDPDLALLYGKMEEHRAEQNPPDSGFYLDILIERLDIPFGPTVSDCLVMIDLKKCNSTGVGSMDLEFGPGVSGGQIADVLRALLRFFESEQFRSIDFDKVAMLVERNVWGTVSLVKDSGGYLRDDGSVEMSYPVSGHPREHDGVLYLNS